MRWLLLIVVALLVLWKFSPQPEPVPVEESFIADQVKHLENAEQFEQQHLEAVEARNKAAEAAIDDPDG